MQKIRLRGKINSYVADSELIDYCKEAESYLEEFTGYVLVGNSYILEGDSSCLSETQSPVLPLAVPTCNDNVKLNVEFEAGVYARPSLYNSVFSAFVGCVNLLINGCDCELQEFSNLFINLRRISTY